MAPCPSEETLARLLADELTRTERDAVALHVEACAQCQENLARLTESASPEKSQRATPFAAFDEAEEVIVSRLKLARRSLPVGSADPASAALEQRGLLDSAPTNAAWPIVPGYEIIGVLGSGGMAVVFKARQLALQRTVALKMLRNWSRVGEKAQARFHAEAGVIARLQHPNILQIYDIGDLDGRPYFALEYVAGGSLAHYLNGTPQPPLLAAQFVEILARAVQAAHANGVVHRDLKPANILLIAAQPGAATASNDTSSEGMPSEAGNPLKMVPKIADFGVAKSADGDWEAQSPRSLTVTGELLGTPSYMAPEQAAPTGPQVGPAADIYALGAILYELLTGRPPFKGATPLDTVLQVLHSDPVSVTDLQPKAPRDIETVCHKCLRKDPGKRYLTARELADDLQVFLRGGRIRARPMGALERIWRWTTDHPVPSGLVAAGLVLPVVALVVLSLLSARLVRASALESAMQQAELLEQATNQYSQIVQRVEKANFPVNKMVPPTPDTVPLSIPATFLHDVGEQLHQDGKTGIQVRQYSDYPFPWRSDGGPRDDFEREALVRLRQSNGHDSVHEFTVIDGEPVVRYAQARIMKQSCVDCHNTHPLSTRKNWKVGDVRGILEIIRPLKSDEVRITRVLQLTVLLSTIGSGLLLLGSLLAVWTNRRRGNVAT